MQIQQINCQYLPEEDRLLLRINTSEKLEHQYIMTRRYLKLVLRAMAEYFKVCEKKAVPIASPEAQKAMGEFEHQKAIEQTDLKKSFKEYEKANKATLLYSLDVKTDEKLNLTLSLMTKDKKGVELVMPNDMAHSFFHLLEKTIVAADWGLNLYFTSKTTGSHKLQ